MDLSPRLRAVCDLNVAEVREGGRHEFVQRVRPPLGLLGTAVDRG